MLCIIQRTKPTWHIHTRHREVYRCPCSCPRRCRQHSPEWRKRKPLSQRRRAHPQRRGPRRCASKPRRLLVLRYSSVQVLLFGTFCNSRPSLEVKTKIPPPRNQATAKERREEEKGEGKGATQNPEVRDRPRAKRSAYIQGLA